MTRVRRCQRQLRADEVGQHLVEIVEHVLQKFSLRPRLDCGKQEVAEGAAIFQKENRQHRDHQEKPRLLGDIGHAEPHALRDLCDFVAMAHQERLRPVAVDFAFQPWSLPRVLGDLAGAEFVEQRRAETVPGAHLPGSPWGQRPRRTLRPAQAAGRRSRQSHARARAAVFPADLPAGSSGRRRRWRTETRSRWCGPHRESPAPARTTAP